MCRSASRRPSPRAALSFAVGAVVLRLLAGCYAQHPCVDEVCNGVDDDCDGITDEGFADDEGRYVASTHCGGCDVDCARVFPTALETACELDADGRPTCVIEACAPGERLRDQGACIADVPALCLPCDADADCALRLPGARCLADGSGAGRCGEPCTRGSDCPLGFRCFTEDGALDPQCAPVTGTCVCSPELVGATLACELRVDGARCPGARLCTPEGLAECEAVLDEACNGVDEDCDGRVDEGFTDALGRYVTRENCGRCGQACVEPGPHTLATCEASGASGASCEVRCEEGFVDVDGLLATGCECELSDGIGVVIGADGDCDGEVDETPEFIFVSQRGDDSNDGEDLARPVRTVQRGLARGAATGRTVLVARGIYQGPFDLLDGVSILGGYRNDFRERDVELYPVLLELADGEPPGGPVLRGRDVTSATVVSGFTVVASDAVAPGEGSTAVLLDGCGPELRLSQLTVLAGRGAAGAPGADSSARLSQWGLASLSQLSGVPGRPGADGNAPLEACPAEVPAQAGVKQCQRGDSTADVSGGAGGPGACPDLSFVCQNGSTLQCANAGCTDFTVDGECDVDAVLSHPSARPNPIAEDGRGPVPGVAGGPSYNSPSNRDDCYFCDDNPSVQRSGGGGGDGRSGIDGASGTGCDAAHVVDVVRGRVGAGAGGVGMAGGDGSGGGGGTAGAGFAVIGNTLGAGTECSDVAGGGGGGGGSGGCGAPGATGGGGGGTSVAILMRVPPDGAGPGVSDVRLVTASGGAGGDGGIGAAGGPGGAGGLGGDSNFWCARNGGRGGDGGRGGHGGGGGGGCGGGSYGVYLMGAPSAAYLDVLAEGLVVDRTGVPGRAGAGGFSPGESGGDGRAGAAGDVFVP